MTEPSTPPAVPPPSESPSAPAARKSGEPRFTIEELRESAALRLGVGPHVFDGALVAFSVTKKSMTVAEAKRLVERFESYEPEVS